MEKARALAEKIGANIEKIVIGKKEATRNILIALISGGHILIEDVPGVGKTTLVSSVAKSLDCSFRRIQFTPDILPSDITGFSMVNFKTGEMEFHEGAIMSQIILADEINRTSPKTQSSLLEVMQEHQVTVDGVTYPMPEPFMVLATQNPIEYAGTFPLPEAQLDRFFMRISMGYPSVSEEAEILARFGADDPLTRIDTVASAEDVLSLREEVKGIRCEDEIRQYVARIAQQSRRHPDLQLGISPRGSLALYKAAAAYAMLAGRDYVIPDDVQKMAIPVLAHRLVLKPEARLKDITQELMVERILAQVEVPVLEG